MLLRLPRSPLVSSASVARRTPFGAPRRSLLRASPEPGLRGALIVLCTGIILAFGLPARPAQAYNLYRFGENDALKWGSNQLGTPGGIVTWSLMPDGTPFDPSVAAFGWSGTSNLSSIYAQVGGQAAALAAMEAAFDAWEAVADIQFVRIDETGTLPFAAATPGSAVVGHIRVGAFAFAPGDFTGAVGYSPPPNGGTTLEGDVVFNVNNRFGIPAGSEAQPFDLYPPPTFFYLNDLAGLFAHEVGHALGLAHTDVAHALMCGYVDPGFDGSACHWADPDLNGQAPITRKPKLDDALGAQALYGVPEPGFAGGIAAGALVLSRWVGRKRSPRSGV